MIRYNFDKLLLAILESTLAELNYAVFYMSHHKDKENTEYYKYYQRKAYYCTKELNSEWYHALFDDYLDIEWVKDQVEYYHISSKMYKNTIKRIKQNLKHYKK